MLVVPYDDAQPQTGDNPPKEEDNKSGDERQMPTPS